MITLHWVFVPVIVGIASVAVFLLGSHPLKYTVAAICISPVVLGFALIGDKRKFMLGAIALALPFARMNFFLGPRPEIFHAGGAQSVPQINLVDLLLVAAILQYYFSGRLKWPDRPRLFFMSTASLVAFLVWCALSIVLSDFKVLGFSSLFDLSKVSLLWFYVVSHVRKEGDVGLVVRCLLLGLALQGMLGVYQAYFGFPEWANPIAAGNPTTLERLDSRSFLRVGGTMGWTTVFAQYLILLIPLSLVKLVHSPSWRIALGYAVCSFLSITALVFTLSRAGWVSLAIGSAITGILLYWHGGPRIRSRLILALTGVLGLFLLYLPLMKERLSSDDYGSSMARLPMIRVAWDIIQQNPVLGTGLNTYSEVMHHYDPKHLIGGFDFPVHNMYLFIAAEIGIPGLLFFLLFLGAIILGLLKISRNTRGHISVISIGILGGVVAMLTHGLVEGGIKSDVELWYVFSAVCGLAAAIPGALVQSHLRNPSEINFNNMNVFIITNDYHPIVGGVEKGTARLAAG